MSDLYDRLEARHEAHKRAAREMAAMLGVSPDKARDDKGRSVGTADAGEKGASVMPTPTFGHMVMAHIEDDRSYRDRA